MSDGKDKELPVPGSIEDRMQHPAFRQPEDLDVKVWRYMDLSKYMWLLTKSRMVFARLDKLADQHEGTLTPKTVEWMKRLSQQHPEREGWDVMSKLFQESRRKTFVCCWHAGHYESEAMWRLYCGQAGGIAIQSTYRRLVEFAAAYPDIYVGCVNYIDYDQANFPIANLFIPPMHKRIAFAHEQEVRLVYSPSRSSVDPVKVPLIETLPWDGSRMVDRVYVSPYAPEYFFEAVQTTTRMTAPMLADRLVWSYMKVAPVV